jgi:O-antigen/teichoic acid export membrane protein
MMEKADYHKATTFYLVGTLFGQGMSFFTVPIFTRILSTNDYGIVTTYMSWVSILGMLIGFALFMGIRAAFIDYREKIDDFFSTIIVFTIFIFFGVSIIVFGGITLFHINISLALVFMCLVHSFASAVIQDYSMYLMMQYRYKARTALMVLPNLFSIICSTLAIVFVLKTDLYMGRIVPTAVITFTFAAILMVLIFRKGKFIIDKEYLKYGIAVSAPLILHGISLNILSQSDRTMITWLANASQTGIYSLVYNFSMIGTVIMTAFEGVWVPWFLLKLQERKIDAINSLAKDYVNLMTYAMVCLILIAPEILKLLASKQYWEGISIIPPIILANYVIFLYTLYVNVEHFHKKTVYITYNTVIAATCNLILNYIFIPQYGYVAAAYTTIISYILSLVLHSRYAKKLEPDIYPLKTFIRPILHILVTMGLFYVLIDMPMIRLSLMLVYLATMLFRERKGLGEFSSELRAK